MRLNHFNFGILFLFLSWTAQADSPFIDQDSLNHRLRKEALVGRIPRIEELVKQGADLNGQASYGETALEYTTHFGRHKASIRLLELGANPNVEESSGISPLYRAAGDCNASRVVEALLAAGAQINHQDLYGRTALMNAVRYDCTKNVIVILDKTKDTIDLEAQDNSLQTVFDLARNGFILDLLKSTQEYQNSKNKNLSKPVLK